MLKLSFLTVTHLFTQFFIFLSGLLSIPDMWSQTFCNTLFSHSGIVWGGGVLLRDSATSAMRGWEHWKPDGLASELFLDQLILLES
jgi:hypothetical protein